VYCGGIGDCVSFTRVTQREAIVPPSGLEASRLSRVTSEFGAPPLGVAPWQLMHFAASTPATSHGSPVAEFAPPPVPPPVPVKGETHLPVRASQKSPALHTPVQSTTLVVEEGPQDAATTKRAKKRRRKTNS
jgi:hypothetical protein